MSRTTARALLLVGLMLSVLASAACAPVATRGGEGTDNPELDDPAMSTKLDKRDVDYLVEQNLSSLYASKFWMQDVDRARERPIVAIFPIWNDTSEHLDAQMNMLLSAIETSMVNTNDVTVVSRERQSQLINEISDQQGSMFDPAHAARVGRMLGARYYVTGKLGSIDERIKRTRRVQYTLFLQVIDIETSAIMFQKESARSKAMKG